MWQNPFVETILIHPTSWNRCWEELFGGSSPQQKCVDISDLANDFVFSKKLLDRSWTWRCGSYGRILHQVERMGRCTRHGFWPGFLIQWWNGWEWIGIVLCSPCFVDEAWLWGKTLWREVVAQDVCFTVIVSSWLSQHMARIKLIKHSSAGWPWVK